MSWYIILLHFGIVFTTIEFLHEKNIGKPIRQLLEKGKAMCNRKKWFGLSNEINELLVCKICGSSYISYLVSFLSFFVIPFSYKELIFNICFAQIYGVLIFLIYKLINHLEKP
jgi:uncharacterized membrane protein YadS